MQEAEESHTKRRVKKGKNKKFDGHGSLSDRGGGNSILGGISLGSAGSRYSRTSRSKTGGGGSAHERKGGDTDYGIAARNNSMNVASPYGSAPIADHFAETTVLFADMAGFTAWSSVREPTQVFTLLETIYHAL